MRVFTGILCIAVAYSLKLYFWPTSRGNVISQEHVLKKRNEGQTVVALLCSCTSTCAVSNIMHLAGKAGKRVLMRLWPVQIMLWINSSAEVLSSETIVIVNCLNIQELDIYCTALQKITISRVSELTIWSDQLFLVWAAIERSFSELLSSWVIIQHCWPSMLFACFMMFMQMQCCSEGVCLCSEQHSTRILTFL